MLKFYVLNLAVPGAILGVVHALTFRSALDQAEKIFHRHAKGCGITVTHAEE